MDEDYIPDEVRVWIINNAIDVATVLIWLHANPSTFQMIVTTARMEEKRNAMEDAHETARP